MRRPRTQRERVLAALRLGPTTPIDWLAPNVRDDGKPILRLGARIHELREDGHAITMRLTAGGVAEYRLLPRSAPRVASVPQTSRGDSDDYAPPTHAPQTVAQLGLPLGGASTP